MIQLLDKFSNFLSRRSQIILMIFLGVYLGAHIGRLTFCADSWIQVAAIDSDDHHFLNNLRLMFDDFMSLRMKSFFYNSYSWGYGVIYWLGGFFVGLPAMLCDNQFILILSERLFSFIPSLGTIYLLWRLLRKKFFVNSFVLLIAFLIIFLKDIFIFHHSLIHPEGLYIFFVALAFYCLAQDNGLFLNWYRAGIVSFAFALSTKLIALPAGIMFIIYFLHWRKNFKMHDAFIGFLYGISTICILNIMLFFPLIREHFFKWVFNMGNRSFGHENGFSFFINLMMQIKELIKIYPGFVWVITAFIASYFCVPIKNLSQEKKLLMFMAFAIVLAYAFFLVFILGNVFFVYGYITYYYLFFLLAALLNISLPRGNKNALWIKFFLIFSAGFTNIAGMRALLFPWTIVVNQDFYQDPITFSDVAASTVFLDSASRFLDQKQLLYKLIYVSPMAGIQSKNFRQRIQFFTPESLFDNNMLQANILCFRTTGKEGKGKNYGDFYPLEDIERAPWIDNFDLIFDNKQFRVYSKKEK